jgi:hypothetical protein
MQRYLLEGAAGGTPRRKCAADSRGEGDMKT